jgi:hypothetical protein
MDFIIGLPPITIRDGTEKDTILIIVDYYIKINKFFTVSIDIKS